MNLQHHFLIAMPALQDPIFRRSVVYICEYNDEGAMGIIINKPLENLQVEGILEKLKIVPEPRNPEIRLDKPVLEDIFAGKMSFQRAFMAGEMKMKGEFRILRAMDQIFVFQ